MERLQRPVASTVRHVITKLKAACQELDQVQDPNLVSHPLEKTIRTLEKEICGIIADGNERIQDHKCLRRVVVAARTNPRSAALQRACGRIMTHLAEQDANLPWIRKCGVVELLIAAAAAHRQNVAVQMAVANAVFMIANTSGKAYKKEKRAQNGKGKVDKAGTDRRHIVECGGVECFVEGGYAHLADAAVQAAITRALWRLTSDDALNAAYTLRHGGVEYLADAAAAHPGDVTVQVSVARALYNITADCDSGAQICQRGGVQCLVAAATAMAGKYKEDIVLRLMAKTFRRVAVCASNIQALREHGGIKCLHTISESRRNKPVKRDVYKALSTITTPKNPRGNRVPLPPCSSSDSHGDSNTTTGSSSLSSSTSPSFCSSSSLSPFHSSSVPPRITSSSEHHEPTGSKLDMKDQIACAAANISDAGEQTRVAIFLGLAANPVKVCKLGGVDLLMTASAAHIGDAEVQQALAGTMARLAEKESNQDYICQHGGIECLLAIVTTHCHQPDILISVATALAYLARKVCNSDRIREHGGAERLLDVSATHMEDSALQLAVLKTLKNIACEELNCAYVRQCNGIEYVLRVRAEHASDVDIQLAAAKALASLAGDGETGIYICTHGGVEGLVAAASIAVANPNIQAAVGKALRALACIRSQSQRRYIGDNGGVDCLMRACKAHVASAMVVNVAARALRNLAYDEATAVRVCDPDSDHVESLLAAAAAHHKDSKVQLAIVSVLVTLARHEYTRSHIFTHGGVDFIFAASSKHTGDHNIQRQAITAFKLFANKGFSMNTVVVDDVVVERITAAAMSYDNEIVHENFLNVALCLAHSPETRQTLQRFDGQSLVVALMRDYRDHGRVLARALKVLHHLVKDEETATFVCGTTGVELLLEIQQNYCSSTPVHNAAVAVLWRMTAHDTLQNTLREFGVFNLLDTINCNIPASEVSDHEMLWLISRHFLRQSGIEPLSSDVRGDSVIARTSDGTLPWEDCSEGDCVLKKIRRQDLVPSQGILGRGKFAEVTQAFYERIQQNVAVKTYYGLDSEMVAYNDRAVTDSAWKLFRREIKLLAKLKPHRNIVRMLGVVFTDDEPVSIIFELMPCTLCYAIHENRADWPSWMSMVVLLRDVACGLVFLHENNVIHRDIKPPNVLLITDDNGWIAKICDLGLAQKWDTAISCIAGTDPYMAPEAKTENVTNKVDVFALGVVIMETVVRVCPSPGARERVTVQKRTKSVILESERRVDHLVRLKRESGFLRTLVDKCIEDEPHKRSSAAEVHASLDRMLEFL